MTYKVGQTVFHLSHGVGKIVGIETREFAPGKEQSFYIINIQDNGAVKKVFVPASTSEARLRPIVTSKGADRVLELIKAPWVGDEQSSLTWNRRYREYMEKIHTGNNIKDYSNLHSFVEVAVVGQKNCIIWYF